MSLSQFRMKIFLLYFQTNNFNGLSKIEWQVLQARYRAHRSLLCIQDSCQKEQNSIVEDNIIFSIFCHSVIFLWVFEFVVSSTGGRRPAGPSPAGPSPGVDPWSLIVSGSKHPWPLDLSGPDNNIPVGPTRSTLTCEFGRQLNQQGSCRSLYMSNKAADCPPNFSCQSAFGLCCLGTQFPNFQDFSQLYNVFYFKRNFFQINSNNLIFLGHCFYS